MVYHQNREEALNTMEAHLFGREANLRRHFDWDGTGELVVHTTCSPTGSGLNEDSLLVLDLGHGRGLFAVADGVGGHPGGEQASKLALEVLRDNVQERTRAGGSLREGLLSGFDAANAAILELGTGGGTTLAAIEIDKQRIRAYHVGDSSVLAFGGRGKIKLETISHSPVGYALEAGLISEAAARVHEDRHVVFNIVGDADMHIGISPPLSLKSRDTVLLASDGLFDNLAVGQVVDELRKGSLEAGIEKVVLACQAKMGSDGHPDDLTLIAFRPSTIGKSATT